jgi:hypothetical protein
MPAQGKPGLSFIRLVVIRAPLAASASPNITIYS